MSNVALRKRRSHGAQRSEYALYLIIAYPVLLIAACMLRIAPKGTRYHGVRCRRPSVFREAWEMGQSALPWVFAGR
jgi:hypothetical protein